MKSFHKKLGLYLVFSIVLSVLAILSIVGIIIFAINGKTIFMWLSIAYVAFSFYGLPFFWIHFGNLNRYYHVCKLIQTENIFDTSIICSTLQINETDSTQAIIYLIKKGYLRGYLFIDNKLVKNSNKVNETHICPFCGSSQLLKTKKGYQCTYCSSTFN
jgi:DNA-directed RNA polymerase subunit RPC12/RpoP